MTWILYWLVLLTASTGVIYWCVDQYSHGELDLYNLEQGHRIDQAYLATKSIKSRIKNRPDL